MKLSYRVFWLAKNGSTSDEYEDAFAPEQEKIELETQEFCCAVADGATETSFSGLWAKMLCQQYTESTSTASGFDLASLQKNWLQKVSGKSLPWYAEQKMQEGAFATFLGLKLKEEKKSIYWSARALGDSCLFQIRKNELIRALPLAKWQDFDFSPYLISSNAASNDKYEENLLEENGTCLKGDRFYLMTDAISQWLLYREAVSADAVSLLESINSFDDFVRLVDSQRQLKDADGRSLMHNDDVTWTRISLS